MKMRYMDEYVSDFFVGMTMSFEWAEARLFLYD